MGKRKLASALGYSPKEGDSAPRLLALGRGTEAEHIVSLAQKAGVTIVEDSALATLLDTSAKPGDLIPPWCWEAAAKILAFVARERYI